jgi:hypothetical protein
MSRLTTYTPFRNHNVRDFVLARLQDLDFVPLWMGRAKGDAVKDKESEYFKMVKAQQWVPTKKLSNWNE